MKRREFIAGIGGTAAVWPLTARGQQPGRVWRIGYLGVGLASNWTSEVEALRCGLRDLGCAEGKNIFIEFRWAERANQTLDLATQLVRLNVDVIFAPASTHVESARKVTKNNSYCFRHSCRPRRAGRCGEPLSAGRQYYRTIDAPHGTLRQRA